MKKMERKPLPPGAHQACSFFFRHGDRSTALSQSIEPGTLFSLDPPDQDNCFPLPGMKWVAPAVRSPGAGHSHPEEFCLTENANEDRNFFIATSTSVSSLVCMLSNAQDQTH